MHFANVIIDSEWQANIHGAKKYEAWGNWKGGGLLLADSKVDGLQVPAMDNFLTIVFKASLQSYLKIATSKMKRSTLQQHKEATIFCEEGMTIVETSNALLIPHSTK
jgi:hypothetical protein